MVLKPQSGRDTGHPYRGVSRLSRLFPLLQDGTFGKCPAMSRLSHPFVLPLFRFVAVFSLTLGHKTAKTGQLRGKCPACPACCMSFDQFLRRDIAGHFAMSRPKSIKFLEHLLHWNGVFCKVDVIRNGHLAHVHQIVPHPLKGLFLSFWIVTCVNLVKLITPMLQVNAL